MFSDSLCKWRSLPSISLVAARNNHDAKRIKATRLAKLYAIWVELMLWVGNTSSLHSRVKAHETSERASRNLIEYAIALNLIWDCYTNWIELKWLAIATSAVELLSEGKLIKHQFYWALKPRVWLTIIEISKKFHIPLKHKQVLLHYFFFYLSCTWWESFAYSS